MDFLKTILKHKREEVARRKSALPVSRLRDKRGPGIKDFTAALSGPGLNVIAEIKKASPSRGVIREDFDPLRIAGIYEKGGAAAISVLTEEKYFLGSLDILREVVNAVSVPVLRKDFIIDEYQLYEAAHTGAGAALLIAAILEQDRLSDYVSLARDLGMAALIEVHNEDDLEKTLKSPGNIIGINNRDLRTFATDLQVTFRLKKQVPADGYLVVSESGIQGPQQLILLKEAGVNAVLVGEALMREPDIGAKLKEFMI
jgi:indole-3-glycerol phosphate synthase